MPRFPLARGHRSRFARRRGPGSVLVRVCCREASIVLLLRPRLFSCVLFSCVKVRIAFCTNPGKKAKVFFSRRSPFLLDTFFEGRPRWGFFNFFLKIKAKKK